MQPNRVSVRISEADQAQLEAAIQSIETILKPYVVLLTPESRQTLPKLTDATFPFVQKALDYAAEHAEFLPPYVDLMELHTDFDAAHLLMRYIRRMSVIHSAISDTAMLSGSEAYMAALAFYNAVKYAAKQNIPGAEAIYQDLVQHFSSGS
jgi:hypothetical protein